MPTARTTPFLLALRESDGGGETSDYRAAASRRQKLADVGSILEKSRPATPAKLPNLPPNDAARCCAWTLAARVLLNLDETISKKLSLLEISL